MTRHARTAGYTTLALASLCAGTAAILAQGPPEGPPVPVPMTPGLAWYSALVTLLLTLIPWVTGGITGGFVRAAFDSVRGRASWEFEAMRDTVILAGAAGVAAGFFVSLRWDITTQFVAAMLAGLTAPELVHAWVTQVRERSPAIIDRILRRSGGNP